jgi:hypothetical protein
MADIQAKLTMSLDDLIKEHQKKDGQGNRSTRTDGGRQAKRSGSGKRTGKRDDNAMDVDSDKKSKTFKGGVKSGVKKVRQILRACLAIWMEIPVLKNCQHAISQLNNSLTKL